MSMPLTHARIGYDHLGLRGTVVASSESAGFPASAANNDLTHSFWKPSGLPALYEVAVPTPEPCDYFGIAAHDLRSTNTVAVMQAYISGVWTTLPVLTKLGELWTWKDGLEALGGLSHGGTFANRRRGYGVDGSRIVDENGQPEAHTISPYSLASEGALSNDVATNVATGTDADGDTSGFSLFTGSGPLESSTDHAVSGSRSLKVPAGNTVQTSSIVASGLTAYSATLKVWCDVAGQCDVFLQDDVTELDNKTVNLNPGEWTYIHITGTSDAAATEVYLLFSVDADAYVDEIAIYQGATRQTWIDTGAEDASGLLYYPAWLQQLAGDVTVNMWVRMPTGSFGANQTFLNIEDSLGGFLRIRALTPARDVSVQTSANGSQTHSHTISAADHPFGGEWHMITVVMEASAFAGGNPTKRLYFDGLELATAVTDRLPNWGFATDFQVGHTDNGTRMTADGQTLMSGLSVVNWAATAAEISGWYSEPASDLPGLGLPVGDDDRPIMRMVQETTATRFRIGLVGPSVPTVGVVRMGKALEMMRPVYGGHVPISLSRSTVIRPNISERGQFLGNSVIRSGARGSWSWTNLTAPWVRRYLAPFITWARTRTFFLSWRPQDFPNEAAYCWTKADLNAANMGQGNLMSFTLEAEGLGHE